MMIVVQIWLPSDISIFILDYVNFYILASYVWQLS